jgi:hypothetical protein
MITPLLSLIDKQKLAAICGHRGLQFVERCCNNLPFSSYCMMELRMNGKNEAIDLSKNYQRSPLQFGSTYLNHPQWQWLDDFFLRWNNPSSLEYIYINDIWTELDYRANADEIAPILFCTLKALPKNDIGRALGFIESAFTITLTEAKNACIEKLLALLPDNATISHIAYMQNRHGQPLRFNVKHLNIEQLSLILSEIEVEHAALIVACCAKYLKLSDSFTLALDITDRFEPRVGIEFFFANQEKSYPKISAFIEQLEADGLTSSENAMKVKNWPSVELIDPELERYPENLRRLSRYLAPEAVGVFWNIINHIKLVIEPQQTEAKAYLAYGHSCDLIES